MPEMGTMFLANLKAWGTPGKVISLALPLGWLFLLTHEVYVRGRRFGGGVPGWRTFLIEHWGSKQLCNSHHPSFSLALANHNLWECQSRGTPCGISALSGQFRKPWLKSWGQLRRCNLQDTNSLQPSPSLSFPFFSKSLPKPISFPLIVSIFSLWIHVKSI